MEQQRSAANVFRERYAMTIAKEQGAVIDPGVTAAQEQYIFGMAIHDRGQPNKSTTMEATTGVQQIQHTLATVLAIAPNEMNGMDAPDAFLHEAFGRLRMDMLPPPPQRHLESPDQTTDLATQSPQPLQDE